MLIYLAFLGLLFCFLLLMVLEMAQDIFFKKVPYVRSGDRVIRNALKEIAPAKGQVVCDLGAGDGKFLRALTRKYPGVRAVGFEKSLLPFLISKLFFSRKYIIVCKDFHKANLSRADYVYAFLYPGYMKGLEAKARRELKPGAVFVSSTFPFPDWQPVKEVPLEDGPTKNWGRLFIYRQP